MKKYFLKGKQFLSRKLQQLDIQTAQIDYIGEQTPNRLQQCLQVLRWNDIDLQESAVYQTYFKNYPNHHVSCYLLDKYLERMKETESSNANKNNFIKCCKNLYKGGGGGGGQYSSWKNVQDYDQQVLRSVLIFKECIEQYEEQYFNTQEPLICICVIHFHHKRGTQIQYKYPNNPKLQPLYNNIIHHAMPDSSHLRDQDFNFFNFESDCLGKKKMMFGVSYFKQIKTTSEMKKINAQITRSHVQKAVAVISSLPLFQYLKLKLQNTTQQFFDNFTNFQIIKSTYINLNQSLAQAWPNIQLNDLYMGCNLKKIITVFGVNQLFEIWKALLYQKRVVIFANSSSDASSFILSLLSLFPGLSTFGVCSKPISRNLQALRQYALPLRIFSSQNILAISFQIQDFEKLAKFVKNEEGNFLLGTTNRLIKQSNQYGIQMLVNLQQGTISKRNKVRRPWVSFSKKQKNFISDLKQLIQKHEDPQQFQIQDLIRNSFHDFLKSALLGMIVGIRKYQIFIKQCEKYEKQIKKVQKKQVSKKQVSKKSTSYKPMQDQQQNHDTQISIQPLPQFPPTFPSQTQQLLFPQLLLNKSFGYFRQFHNQHLPQIITMKIIPSIQLNNYEYIFHLNSEQFIYYHWIQKKIIFGKGDPFNCQGGSIKFQVNHHLDTLKINNCRDDVKNIYIGSLYNGKYHQHGFYFDTSENYEGFFQNGLKHGEGKYENHHQRYIGDFKNNLYDGQGQLMKDGNTYIGIFKQGLKHGHGQIVQGDSNRYEGQWKLDKLVKQENVQKNEGQEKKRNGRKPIFDHQNKNK